MNSHYFYLPKAYIMGNETKPDGRDLKDDTQHPELNSRTFLIESQIQYKPPSDFLPFFCHLESSESSFVLATNNFKTCVFDGSLIGAEKFETIVNHNIEEASFQYPEKTSITALQFLDPEYFLVALKNSRIKLWNTRLIKKGFGLSGDKGTDGYGLSIAKLQNDSKFVLATSNARLEIHDYNLGELTLSSCYEQAHGASITGVAAHPSSAKTWATCSSDRSCVLWDVGKKEKPALRILNNYNYQLTAIHWTNQTENKELLVVGDEAGNVLTLDVRCPDKILSKTRVEKRAVKKFCFNGSKRFGVVTKTNATNFFEIQDGEMNHLYKQCAPGIVYSMCCDPSDQNVFYAVGEEMYAEKISFA